MTSTAGAQTPANNHTNDFVEEVTIVGQRIQGNQVAGSAHYISQQQIRELGQSDIQRIIRQVPGVSVQVEDGYGLRPNIAIRGVATERSGRITLLEDNVLISPAPYSAPSAYYFPTIGRISAIEVLKGPAAITQGPYTIGGALNLISTPIPEIASGRVVVEGGEDQTYRVHATYGANTNSGFGFLLETHQWQSDGFQDIDGGGNSGLDVEDYIVKLRYSPSASNHSFELKLQLTEQSSDQTYLGLSDADLRDNAFRRYALSALDNIKTKHDQVTLRYNWDIRGSLSFNAVIYNNNNKRNWFKNEGIDFNGSANAQNFSRTNWFDVIQAVNRGESLAGFSATQLQGILSGSIDTPSGSVQLRSNTREYFARGIQVGLDWSLETGRVSHDINMGLRLHEDEEDRLQRNSTYSQTNGRLVLDDFGLLGNAGNRIQSAEAFSVHIYDRIEVGQWVLTPGLRYEDIDQQRIRFEIRPERTVDPAVRSADNFRSSRKNTTQIWLPGFGVIYNFNDQTSVFGGVHKGFTAPTNAPNVGAETAINYELGIRFDNGNVVVETAYFLSDYDNILGECTASSGSDCVIGDAFNGDAATVRGLELSFSTHLNANGEFSFPVQLSYTYIDSQFDTDIADADFFGDVSAGDPIPYLPKNQLNMTIGLQQKKWALFVNASYVDEVCVLASCGPFERTDNSLTFDLSSNYKFTDNVELFARVENLTGEEDIIGRQPYGARPNKSRTAYAGFRIEF
ncbi:MAG: TonB-dependent receptor [Gammaproteobacteria bacterium]|nr:TonB-dependent receptor [Gammaproteobacteria bacterium]